jgi:hypothetical protein
VQYSDCVSVSCSITAMKNRKIKMALGTVFLVGAGVAIPAWAVGLSAALYAPSQTCYNTVYEHQHP